VRAPFDVFAGPEDHPSYALYATPLLAVMRLCHDLAPRDPSVHIAHLPTLRPEALLGPKYARKISGSTQGSHTLRVKSNPEVRAVV
jgi:hypothetical protein